MNKMDALEKARYEWRVDVTFEVAILLLSSVGRLWQKVDKAMGAY